MESYNICHCGAAQSYPHSNICPYPYYGNDPGRTKDWNTSKKALATAVKNLESGNWTTDTAKLYLENNMPGS